MAHEYDQVAVERLFVGSEWSAAIVFLPEGREDDGSGVYDEGLISLAQDLRDNSVTVSWADEPGQRSFRSQRSAADILWGAIAGFPVNIMASAAYAKLAQWFKRVGNPSVIATRESVPIVAKRICRVTTSERFTRNGATGLSGGRRSTSGTVLSGIEDS
jgi:hypothetical protein